MPAVFPEGSALGLRSTYTGYYPRTRLDSPLISRGVHTRTTPTYSYTYWPSWDDLPYWYGTREVGDLGGPRSSLSDRFRSPSPLVHSYSPSLPTWTPTRSRLMDLPTSRSKYEMDCRYLPSPTWRSRLSSPFGRYIYQWRTCRGTYV